MLMLLDFPPINDSIFAHANEVTVNYILTRHIDFILKMISRPPLKKNQFYKATERSI